MGAFAVAVLVAATNSFNASELTCTAPDGSKHPAGDPDCHKGEPRIDCVVGDKTVKAKSPKHCDDLKWAHERSRVAPKLTGVPAAAPSRDDVPPSGPGSARFEEVKAKCDGQFKCMAEEFSWDTKGKCIRAVEDQAKYKHRWTEGFLGLKFSKYMNGGKPWLVNFVGDEIEFQNGFGAWIPHRYSCKWDAIRQEVVSVEVSPGRLR